MSGARPAALPHLLFKHIPSGTAGEQANQIDQPWIGVGTTALQQQLRLNEPKRIPLFWMVARVHGCVDPGRLQADRGQDWREEPYKQLKSRANKGCLLTASGLFLAMKENHSAP